MSSIDELRQRLKKPLERELKLGCQDNVVAGGLQKLIENLASPFPKIKEALKNYSKLSLSAREDRLRAVLAELEAENSAQKHLTSAKSIEKTVQSQPKPNPLAIKKLNSLGLRTKHDLWHNYPRRYEDRRLLPSFRNLKEDEKVTVSGKIVTKSRFEKNGMFILKAEIADQWNNKLQISWFNQPWVEKILREGIKLIVTGRVKRFGRKLSLNVEYFEQEDEGESLSVGRIIGIYQTMEGISQDFIRKSIKQSLETEINDFLDPEIRKRFNLIDLSKAINAAHFPKDEKELEIALKRLCFDEFLFLELRILLQGEQTLGKSFSATDQMIENFAKILPFELTNAQKRVLSEIANDMRSQKQMARLLQGDVGSGKTAVAACALYLASLDGYQGALMAPTEILARQHFQSLSRYLFPLGLRVELLIGAQTTKTRNEIRQKLLNHEVDVVIGTQALIQEGVEFAKLGLAVIDEEHRFGVLQRRALLKDRPDVLVMSATPIPRSLALTAYGDLELSVIDELPPGRTPIQTKLLDDQHRLQAYKFVMKQIEEGHQIYVVAPLIEESEKLEVLAATQLAEDLTGLLPKARIELLHGKMNAAEKDGVMARFREHRFDLLVSTTVIEVGVDVPNATVIVIENAERFGLSQLHQLRGRVGRGAKESYCILVAGDHSSKTRKRLKVIESSTDGFFIAEADLKLRGPGELRGTQQWGQLDLKLGDLTRDTEIIESARNLAKEILAKDPNLETKEHQDLKKELQIRAEQVSIRDVV